MINKYMKEIIRKSRPLFVQQILVKDLDKTKCSAKFLSHNLPDDTIVNVKCLQDGTLDLRGKKEEYRIIIPDNTIRFTTKVIKDLLSVGYKKGDSSMLNSEFIKEDSIYYKQYPNFIIFFTIDNFGLVCLIECIYENRKVYVYDSYPIPKINELVLAILNNIVECDTYLLTTTLNYIDISAYLSCKYGDIKYTK